MAREGGRQDQHARGDGESGARVAEDSPAELVVEDNCSWGVSWARRAVTSPSGGAEGEVPATKLSDPSKSSSGQ
eukprot:746166-Hanusia_phi.AAC.3